MSSAPLHAFRFYASTRPALELVVKAKRPPRVPGKPRRKVTNTYKRQSSLVERMAAVVQANFTDGINTFKKRVDADALRAAWEKGDYAKVMAVVPWDELPADLQATFRPVGDALGKAVEIQKEALPPNINSVLRFDLQNPEIRHFLKTQTASLVTRIGDDTRHMIQDHVASAFSRAQTPRQVANSIKAGIGILPKHEKALQRYHAGLLADGMAPDKAQALASKYEGRLLDYRAMSIARTETRGAVNHGQLAVWRQGARQGLIDPDTAKKEWVTDGAPCPTCEPMDGVRVGLDDVWTIEYPNGETAQVDLPTEAHTHCMCGMELVFNDETEGEE